MGESFYSERRLVLRQLPGWDVVNGMARTANWQQVASNLGRKDAEYKRTLTWGVAPELWVTYIEDRITGVCVVVAYGVDAYSVNELARKISLLLSPYSRKEILEPFDSALSSVDSARRVIRLALSAGAEFDAAIFERISEASRHPNLEIRNAAAWSTAYLSWPEVESMLQWMAENDSSDQVRAGARALLESDD